MHQDIHAPLARNLNVSRKTLIYPHLIRVHSIRFVSDNISKRFSLFDCNSDWSFMSPSRAVLISLHGNFYCRCGRAFWVQVVI